ncbi:MAG: hypothetical protein MN733_10070 [Nitrososphaera sp.]|nr:hypothetical protein [Nitrososphaera sp.]
MLESEHDSECHGTPGTYGGHDVEYFVPQSEVIRWQIKCRVWQGALIVILGALIMNLAFEHRERFSTIALDRQRKDKIVELENANTQLELTNLILSTELMKWKSTKTCACAGVNTKGGI